MRVRFFVLLLLCCLGAAGQAMLPKRARTPTAVPTPLNPWTDGRRAWSVQYSVLSGTYFTFQVSTNGISIPGTNVFVSGGSATNTWYFVYACHNTSSNTIGISVNNGALQTTPFTGPSFFSLAPLSIGALLCNGLGLRDLDGKIDEAGFWKRSLTASEITALYNSGSGLTYPFAGTPTLTNTLVSYWRLDETNGVRVDSAGANSLISSNGVSFSAGKITNSASFAPVNEQWLVAPYDSSMQVSGSSFACAFWVNLNTVGLVPYGLIGQYDLGLGTPGTLTNGLVSYWKLNEASGTRADSLGTNNLSSSNSVASTAAGIVSSAATFVSASNQYLSAADSSSLSVSNIDFSCAAWLYLNDVGTPMAALGHYDTSSQRSWDIVWTGTTLNMNVSSNGTAVVTLTGPSSVSANTWYFVYAYYDSVNHQLGIALNDGTRTTLSYASGMLDSTARFTIGAIQTAGAPIQPWNGRIDEVGFWKRVLATNEVTTLYQNGLGTTYPFTSN